MNRAFNSSMEVCGVVAAWRWVGGWLGFLRALPSQPPAWTHSHSQGPGGGSTVLKQLAGLGGSQGSSCPIPHNTEGQTEAQGGEETCLRSPGHIDSNLKLDLQPPGSSHLTSDPLQQPGDLGKVWKAATGPDPGGSRAGAGKALNFSALPYLPQPLSLRL